MGKKITMTDIAKEVGVSQTLVSFVLAGKNDMGISTDTKRKVLDTAQRLGYCSSAASRMIKLGRSGYIIMAFAKAVAALDISVVDGICRALHEFGYELVMQSPSKAADIQHCIGLVRDGRADGILVIGEDESFTEQLRDSGILFESVSEGNESSALECGRKLCENILDCSDADNNDMLKKKIRRKKTTSALKSGKKVTKIKTEDNDAKDTKTVTENEKPARKQESIWLL